MRDATRHDYAGRILRVLVYIQHNLDQALDLNDLASMAHFSPFHFHRVFTGMVGESVKQHVRRLRLERAAARLKHSDVPVTSIAFEAGYETHEAFTRAFRQAFDCSPSEFRAAEGVKTRLVSPADVHFVSGSAGMEFNPVQMKGGAMEVRIVSLEPMRVAFVRHVGPYHEVGETWERLMDWVGKECLFGPDVKLFGACWDDPDVTSADRIRYDACVTVADGVEATGEIGVQRFPGGRFATVVHEGPFDQLSRTYAELFGVWFPSSGYRMGDAPSFEFYLNDPNSTEPEDLLTDVYVRIRDDA